MADSLQQRIKLGATPAVYHALAASLRFRGDGILTAAPPGPCIFACLHRDILITIPYVAPARPALLVSRSSDGEILMRTLGRSGFRFVRGSTGKEGGAAFRGLLEMLRSGCSVGIAVDGPKGPFGRIHDGVARLAVRSRAPVVPLLAEPGRHLALKTWDRTIVPAPFGRVGVRVGEPLAAGDGPESAERLVASLREYLLPGEPA